MNITQTHSYPYSLESVFALFASPEFIEEKYSTLNARNIKIKSVKLEESALLVDIRREVPASKDIPTVIKKFVGEWNRTRQKEEWTKGANGWHSQFKVEISGVPARIKGKMHLRPTDTGCENIVSIDISTPIPFVGETLCRFIGQNIEQLAQQEFKIILKHLEEMAVA